MTWSRLFSRARAIGAASLLIAIACERAKSPATVDTSNVAREVSAASSTPSQRGVGPESSPEAMRAFAAAHLRPGLKPGDFLTNKADYPTGDTADVYRAVLDTLYVSKDGFPGQVVLNDFAMTQVVTCERMPCPIIPRGTGSEPHLETLDAYRIAQLNRRHITPKFKYHIPLQLIGETQRREIEIDGRVIGVRDSVANARQGMREHPFWLGFQARYPHAWGMAMLSVVGMNPQKNEAILQVRHACGTYCHSTETMVLWKVRGKWHVVERVPEEGDSTDLGSENLRYRGVGMHTPLHEMRESARRDSIRLAALPRDIHGKITAKDGTPLPGVLIELRMDAQPNGVWRVDADFRGDYRFDGVVVGGAGLMVRCPKASNRPDSLAAVTGTDVGIGKSVEVNFQIDRAICYDPTPTAGAQPTQSSQAIPQPQIIQPKVNVPMQNEFDAARARNSAYPSAEDASVYTAVLDRLAAGGPGNLVVLYGSTRSACKGASCNQDYQRRIRYEPRVMLSAMDNFLAVRERRNDFRADFPARNGVAVVGDSAIVALERATARGNAFSDATVIQQAWADVQYSLSFSAIGFSPSHKQAIVEVMRSGSEPLLCIVNRTANGWQVVRWVKQ